MPTKTEIRSETVSAELPERSDYELAGAIARGEESALRAVVDRYAGDVLRAARRVLRDASLAEEAAQDAFVHLWRRPGSFDPGRGSLKTFLSTIARNKAIDLVRKEEARERVRGSLPPGTPDRALFDDVDNRAELRHAFRSLTDIQREALYLAYFEGLSYRQVAHALGVPEGTAKTRLRDGLLRMRGALAGA